MGRIIKKMAFDNGRHTLLVIEQLQIIEMRGRENLPYQLK
jgi:hypothetical protein